MRYKLKQAVRLNGSYDIYEEVATSESDRQTTIPVFPIGEFEYHHDLGEGFDLTPQRIEEFVENFENGIGTVDGTLPVYQGHGSSGGNDRPAVGWVRELMNRGEKGLWAVVEWTDKGMGLVKSKAYKYISPEWTFAYYDPRSGNEHGSVLFAPALVNEPYFNNMPAITASEEKEVTIINNEAPMNLEELLQKAVEELTEEEKQFIAERRGELSEEQIEKYGLSEEKEEAGEESAEEAPEAAEEATEEKEEPAEEAGEESEAEVEEAPAEEGEESSEEAGKEVAEEAGEAPVEEVESEEVEAPEEKEGPAERVEASEKGMVRMSAAEAKQLRIEAAEYRKGLIVARLEGHTPAAQEVATEIAQELKGESQDKFLTLMASVAPSLKKERVSAGEDIEKVELSKPERMQARIKQLRKEDVKMSYSDAMDIAIKEESNK